MTFSDPIDVVKGVGPALASKFKKRGVRTVGDLLYYFPRRYDDYSNVVKINAAMPGMVTLKAEVKQAKGTYIRGGLHITEAVASDNTGSIRLIWFNQPYRAQSLTSGKYYISGKFEFKKGRLAIVNPVIERADSESISTARIVPVYHETKGLTSLHIRKAVSQVFIKIRKIYDTLPPTIIDNYKLMALNKALYAKHFPASSDELRQADRRLGFEELFEIICASLFARQSVSEQQTLPVPFSAVTAQTFVRHLPFALTNAQRKTIWQVYKDMELSRPMNRLIEGDVGSGKTVVATMASLMALNEGYQVALMAPTELLARQHADTIHNLLRPLGFSDSVVLLVGSMSAREKQRAKARIADGSAKFMIGTHALLQEDVDIRKLALVVIDEQHRFGVDQRKKLLGKAGHLPHMLSMTATPIPRSLALTVFGELDISILDQKPKDRLPVITKLVKATDRLRLYGALDVQLAKGQQMFVVCPLIEESDALKAKSVQETFKEISAKFPKRSVGLLHGKQKAADKQSVMEQFAKGRLDILVSTTVIEVGVDVPNASIMLVEAPERFGLAQLHQLRGRVGRGTEQGYCYLMLSDARPASQRLRAIEEVSDGFKLADLDLGLRGAGALYGTSQHGKLDLRIAQFTDTVLVSQARAAAKSFMQNPENLIKYSYIKKRITELQSVVHLN